MPGFQVPIATKQFQVRMQFVIVVSEKVRKKVFDAQSEEHTWWPNLLSGPFLLQGLQKEEVTTLWRLAAS